ncbi:phosphotransferase [Kineosporia babensis]|uniref:Aminoglycoside phosphotransferase family protein n=1 Tax=Kineosporia babensis TaxID=499548 RepID=A0A9X1NJC3_9ACTN|nr:aminoglycoside phosphotransferase family protein [Kineosporia babensis]
MAVKVLLDPDDAAKEAFAWEHSVARHLHQIAGSHPEVHAGRRNPVVQMLHAEPIDLGDACVAVSLFVDASGDPLTVASWAQTLGILHQIGCMPEALDLLEDHRATNVLFGLRADSMLEALNRPGHPFHDDAGLVREFALTLRERTMRAIRVDPQPLLVHRDFHPLNCINASGGPVAIDWQDASWGNRSDDFAWLHLAVRRFDRPVLMLRIAQHAYTAATDGICPSQEQIEASGQVLELLCLGFSIMNADQGPEYLQECLTELPILSEANAVTGPWRMLNNPAIFAPGLVI